MICLEAEVVHFLFIDAFSTTIAALATAAAAILGVAFCYLLGVVCVGSLLRSTCSARPTGPARSTSIYLQKLSG